MHESHLGSFRSISCGVKLHPTPWYSTGGSFALFTSGHNAPVSLKVTSAPLLSRISVDALANGSPVEAELPSTFEGSVSVSCKKKGGTSLYVEDVPDPAGTGRQRQFNVRRTANNGYEGYIGWGPDVPKAGSVRTESDEAASLTLQ